MTRSILGTLLVMLSFESARAQQKLASSIQEVSKSRSSVKIVESYKVPFMPPMYSKESMSINFCYAFASGTIIGQHIGVQKSKSIVHQEMPSMLELGLRGRGMTIIDLMAYKETGRLSPIAMLDDLGNAYRSLVYAGKKGGLWREACASFDKFSIFRSSNPGRAQEIKKLAELYEQGHALWKSQDPSFETLPTEFRKVVDLPIPNDHILVAWEKDSFQESMGYLLTINQCDQSPIKFRPFNIEILHSLELKQSISKLLLAKLKSGKPATWSFCISDNCQSQHIVVAHGIRKVCGANAGVGTDGCFHQFLVRDSGNLVSNEPGDYWIDQSVIAEKESLMKKNIENLQQQKIPAPDDVMSIQP